MPTCQNPLPRGVRHGAFPANPPCPGDFLSCCCGRLAAEPHADRCVILVTIDGLANFYLNDSLADMPTIHKLAREGAPARGMVSVFPTVTWPNHVALVTGVTTAKTGVVGNSYSTAARASRWRCWATRCWTRTRR